MKYFTIKEMCDSAIAKKYNITNEPNIIERNNIIKLVETLLDPLRERLGQPIIVNCGFRNDRVNKLVEGSVTSAHRKGLAADLRINGNNIRLKEELLKSGLDFDQCIVYHSKTNPSFVHIGLSDRKNRRQVLFSPDGKRYFPF